MHTTAWMQDAYVFVMKDLGEGTGPVSRLHGREWSVSSNDSDLPTRDTPEPEKGSGESTWTVDDFRSGSFKALSVAGDLRAQFREAMSIWRVGFLLINGETRTPPLSALEEDYTKSRTKVGF